VQGQTTVNKTDSVSVIDAQSSDQPVMDQWLEMFALFAHDLESPLASMKYVLRLLEDGKLDLNNPRHRQIVSSTGVAVQRAESVLYDAMAVAKSGQLGFPVNLESQPLEPILREVAGMASISAAENRVKVTVIEPIAPGKVSVDLHLLKRALDNLLFNAIRHTPAGGTVSLATKVDALSICVQIRDTGAGLGDIDTEELFEKYGQIKLRAQRKHRGVGLGLYFCRLAAEAMGGSVSAANHPEGGAVFNFCLRRSGEE
jgi:two-component system, OmpR family, sensor histidine kinase BaeS